MYVEKAKIELRVNISLKLYNTSLYPSMCVAKEMRDNAFSQLNRIEDRTRDFGDELTTTKRLKRKY